MTEVVLRESRRGITWRQPVVCAVTTAVCTVLATWAVVAAPVSLVPGVSGLYIAAAVYVPVALWFGVWGCVAGYFSCVFMGLYFGMPLDFALVWSLADFFEGFIPLTIYRSLKISPASALKVPKRTYALAGLLALNVAVSAFSLLNAVGEVFIATFFTGVALYAALVATEDRRTWLVWLAVGVFLASLVSGIFGVGALAAFGSVPVEIFPTVLFGWVFGDIMVLITIGTILTLVVTPYLMKTVIYVREFFS